MFKQLIIFTCLLMLMPAGWLIYKNLLTKQSATSDSIVLGTMSGWPPFVSINNEGSYEGFDIDIAQEIARRLDKQLVIKDMDTAALITALDQGLVDFIMTGLDITTERLQKIAMIPYQGEPIEELPLVFWEKIPAGIRSLNDLKNIPNGVICVESGSSQEAILRQYSGFETRYSDPLMSILELKYKRALAVLLERKLLHNLKKKYPELVNISIPLDEKNRMMGCGIGIKKSNNELQKQIAKIIDELKKNGFLEEKEKQRFAKDDSHGENSCKEDSLGEAS